jgi:hypothetical protein
MRHLFALPWLTPSRRTLLGIGVVAVLVFGLFALLKVGVFSRAPQQTHDWPQSPTESMRREAMKSFEALDAEGEGGAYRHRRQGEVP